MKIVSLGELHTIDLVIKDISVIFQTPLWTSLGGLGNAHSPRKLNGFLLIQSGGCHYSWSGGETELHPADLIYLPSGAKRQVNVTGSNALSFYRICFRMFDAASSEELLLSKEPYVIREVRQRLFELCEKMLTTTLSPRNGLETLSSLYEFFSEIAKATGNTHNTRVLPALNYLEKHYHESFDVALLAELCYMSLPHLFRVFKRETGKTPLEYKIHLRIERAKMLLADGECQIGEVASMLGFESIYYFSRAFKKQVGMSPTEYQKRND